LIDYLLTVATSNKEASKIFLFTFVSIAQNIYIRLLVNKKLKKNIRMNVMDTFEFKVTMLAFVLLDI